MFIDFYTGPCDHMSVDFLYNVDFCICVFCLFSFWITLMCKYNTVPANNSHIKICQTIRRILSFQPQRLSQAHFHPQPLFLLSSAGNNMRLRGPAGVCCDLSGAGGLQTPSSLSL